MIYLVTNRKLITTGTLLDKIEKAMEKGIAGIILREKDLTTKDLLPLAKQIKELTKDTKVQFFVNGNIEVAQDLHTGVHLSFEAFVENKPKLNQKQKMGVSVHSLEEAKKAEKLGASYLLAGHVFSTDCKKGLAPRGLDFIKNIKENTSIPLIAIGGIDYNNMHQVYQSGADGVAMMSYFMK
ncbi:thiamine phosphate synthase [Serpentinicella sp. ANB-PHB4]|uniref:thiamine phosphate synthase n=1 Tax=Serpentinicella sp. ANB-PHB4 TaxID=3074076 RepID=UPI0028654E79|nr:thiamine phosphate synthase [Serpentinicella sp. ANB-PHB4]MDR5658727.1 thiamine phosphate synthase [Serpentinicella sp. ANB-PHB4]